VRTHLAAEEGEDEHGLYYIKPNDENDSSKQ